MKKHLFALLSLVIFVVGCPSNAPDKPIDASMFEPGLALDAAVDGASTPHRLGSFNPTCTGTGLPHVVSGVQTGACALVSQTADVTGTLPVANGGTGITSLGTGVATFLGTPSGANLASALTTALPVSKGGTNRTALGTGLQVLRTNAGATDTEWATISGSGASAGTTSGQVQAGDGAGGFIAPSNVLAGSGFLSVGASPTGVAGSLRIGYSAGTTQALTVSDSGGTASRTLVKTAGDATTTFGDFALNTILAGALVQVHANSGSTAGIYIDPGYGLVVDGSKAALAVPMVGDTNVPSAYGVHGVGTQAMADNPQTAAAAVYSFYTIKTTGALTLNRALTIPAATDAAAYTKMINNACTGAFSVVVTSAGGGTTVSVANGKSAMVLVDSRGVTRMTGDI